MKKKYHFKQNTRFKNENAQAIGEYLEFNFKSSKVTPPEVVSLAENPNSPIHRYFDWNNKSAAHKYRLLTARNLINALYIKIEDVETRAYEHVFLKSENSPCYVTTDKVFSEKDLVDQVIEQALKELLYWKSKYSLYKEKLPYVFPAINKLEKEKSNGKKKERH